MIPNTMILFNQEETCPECHETLVLDYKTKKLRCLGCGHVEGVE